MASKIVFCSEFPNTLEKNWGRIEMGGILFEKLFFLIFDGMQKWSDPSEVFIRCVFKIKLRKPFEISFGKKIQSSYSNDEKFQ